MARNQETASSPPIPPTLLPRENVPVPPPQGRCGAGRAEPFRDAHPHLWFIPVAKEPLSRKQGAFKGAALPGRALEEESDRGAGVAAGARPHWHLQLSPDFTPGALVVISLLTIHS